MNAYESLPHRHKVFVSELVKNGGNKKEAYQKAYPKANPDSARSRGAKIAKDSRIQNALREISQDITRGEVLTMLRTVMYDSKAKNSDKISAGSLISRINGWIKEGTISQVTVIKEDTIERAREEARLALGIPSQQSDQTDLSNDHLISQPIDIQGVNTSDKDSESVKE